MTKRTLGFCIVVMIVAASTFLTAPALLGRIDGDDAQLTVTLWPPAQALAFVSNEELLIASGEEIQCWNIRTHKLVRSDRAPHRYPSAFLSGSRLLAGGYNDKVTRERFHGVWDVETGALLQRVERDKHDILANKTFSPDGTMVATVWMEEGPRIRNRRKLWTDQYVLTMQDSSTGKKLWQVDGGKDVEARKCLMIFSPDGESLLEETTFVDDLPGAELSLCEARTGRKLKSLARDMRAGITELGWDTAVFSPDGTRVAAVGGNGNIYAEDEHIANIYLWDVRTGRLLWRQSKKSVIPLHLTFSPDGKLLAAGCSVCFRSSGFRGGEVNIWNVESGRLRRTLARETWPDFYANKLEENMRTLRRSLPGNKSKYRGRLPSDKSFPIEAIAFSLDSKLLAASDEDGVVKVWDISK